MQLVIEVGGERLPVGTLAPDEKSVPQTVAAMQAMVDWTVFESDDRDSFAAAAEAIRASAASMSAQGFGDALYERMVNGVRFERDPAGVELIRAPGDMLRRIQGGGQALGDCDDLATLAACLIVGAGLKPVFVTVSPENSDKLEHIFVAIRLGDDLSDRRNLYPLDSQYRPIAKTRTPPGDWPFGIARVKTWGLNPTPPKP